MNTTRDHDPERGDVRRPPPGFAVNLSLTGRGVDLATLAKILAAVASILGALAAMASRS